MAASRKDPNMATRKRKERPVVEDIPEPKKMQLGTGESKFARALGSTDYQTREKGLDALGRWMSSKASLGDSDLLKLWKGIFYCFWHSDKAPVQDDLAKRLSELLVQLKPKVASAYFRTFFLTVRREWLGIDKLRLDKFLLLIRYFLRQMLTLLQKSKWDTELVEGYMSCVLEVCLMPKDTFPAAGVAYHIADIYISEICTVTEASHAKPKVLRALLEPFCAAISTSSSQALINRIRDGVFVGAAELFESGEGPMAGLDCQALAEELFEAAASGAWSQKNRVVLYDLNKKLSKAVKRRAAAEKKDTEATPTRDAEEAPATTPKQMAKSKLKERKPKKGKFVAMGDIVDHNEATAPKSNGKPSSKTTDGPAAESDAQPTPAGKKAKKALKAEATTPATIAPHSDAQPTPAGKKAKKASKAEATTPVSNDSDARPTPAGKVAKKAPKAEATPAAAAPAAKKAKQSPPAETSAQKSPAPQEKAEKLLPATPSTSGKKSVKFSMRNNLYFAFGGPVPEADVRTPTPAKPKGPALKKVSAFGRSQTPHRFGKKGAKPRTPRSAPRASAADFF